MISLSQQGGIAKGNQKIKWRKKYQREGVITVDGQHYTVKFVGMCSVVFLSSNKMIIIGMGIGE